uniref:DUF935 family protein n=2 Tax=Ascaris lumbricoides TaxID=6252 RepID=A0A0M3I7M5_ASCLU
QKDFFFHERIPDLLVSAYNLIDSLGGKHAERGSMNFKFLSPRFAPIMPDKFDNQSRHFSPSFLSFYKDESADNIASLPKVLEDGGMDKRDREAIIETLMDVSGAKDAVNMGLDLLSSFNFTGLEDELVEVLEDGGMDKRDREAIIETLMDVSGAKDAVNMGLDLLSSFNFTGLEDELVEVGMFEKISK